MPEQRKNRHMQHFEDLVLLGQDGLEELDDKVHKVLAKINTKADDLVTTVKIDGCLAPETIVKTTEGDIPMYKLISDYNISGKIYTGYGKSTDGNIKEVKLTFPRVSNGDKEWCLIEFENNSYILATTDHPFYTNDGWLPAIELVDKNIDGYDRF